MAQVVVIGSGVVGATIAYELSQVSGLTVTLVDQQAPAQASTGAALGVLMGIISHKVKGRTWQLREASIRRSQTLIPELEAASGLTIPRNPHGILSLCFSSTELNRWETLQSTRQIQGWPLEIWDPITIQKKCPHLCLDSVVAGIYSPQDGQVDPTQLTLALVKAAQNRGVTCQWQTQVMGLQADSTSVGQQQICKTVQTASGEISADWVIISAGLGSMGLTQSDSQPLNVIPVLGQALRLQMPQALGESCFQPVVNGSDIHLVPLGNQEYWVGATVEFPAEQQGDAPEPSTAQLQQVLEGAIAFCPALAEAKLLKSWSGLRPRPQGKPAPVIEPLSDYKNVLLATGHYRNGVLLAPATAQLVREMILAS